MPFAIYMFALTAFALGLAEFVPIGLSDIIAGSLKVSNESVGAVVSAYALGATISAPIFSALTAAWARKRVMLATALVFSLGSFVAASSSDLTVMVIARFVAGLGHGLFLAVATSVAAQLVGGKRAGAAVALVFGGFTIALAIGVPISTWAGSFVSWRPLFFVITGFGVLGCQSCVDAPIDARCFLKVWHVIRCCRVSGLMMRQFTRRGPVWRSADQVQIGVARSRRSD